MYALESGWNSTQRAVCDSGQSACESHSSVSVRAAGGYTQEIDSRVISGEDCTGVDAHMQ